MKALQGELDVVGIFVGHHSQGSIDPRSLLSQIPGFNGRYSQYVRRAINNIRQVQGLDLPQGESVNILLNFTQFFETRIEYRFQIFTAHSCDFLLPSYARLA